MKLQVYKQGKSLSFSGLNTLSLKRASATGLGWGCLLWGGAWFVPGFFNLPGIAHVVVYGGLLYAAFRYLGGESTQSGLPIVEGMSIHVGDGLFSIEATEGENNRLWDLPLSSISGLHLRTIAEIEGVEIEMTPSQDLPFELSLNLSSEYGESVTVYCHIAGIRKVNDLIQLANLLGSLVGLRRVVIAERAHKKADILVLREVEFGGDRSKESVPSEDSGWVMQALMGLGSDEAKELGVVVKEPQKNENTQDTWGISTTTGASLGEDQDSWFSNESTAPIAEPVVGFEERPTNQASVKQKHPHTKKEDPFGPSERALRQGDPRVQKKSEDTQGRLLGSKIKIAEAPKDARKEAKSFLEQSNVTQKMSEMFSSGGGFSPSSMAPVSPKANTHQDLSFPEFARDTSSPNPLEVYPSSLRNVGAPAEKSLVKDQEDVADWVSQSLRTEYKGSGAPFDTSRQSLSEAAKNPESWSSAPSTIGVVSESSRDKFLGTTRGDWPEWSHFVSQGKAKVTLEWPTWEGRQQK